MAYVLYVCKLDTVISYQSLFESSGEFGAYLELLGGCTSLTVAPRISSHLSLQSQNSSHVPEVLGPRIQNVSKWVQKPKASAAHRQ